MNASRAPGRTRLPAPVPGRLAAACLVLVGCASDWQPSLAPPPERPYRAEEFFLRDVEEQLGPPGNEVRLHTALHALRADLARTLSGARFDPAPARRVLDEAAVACAAHIKSTLGEGAEAQSVPASDAICSFLFQRLDLEPDLHSASVESYDPRRVFPSSVLERGGGDCIGLGLLFLALAERLDVPVRGVLVGTHFFVRYDDGVTKRNYEMLRRGHSHPDWYYRERFEIPYASGDYLRSLSTREVVAVVLYNVAEAYRKAGRGGEAGAVYERVLEILPGFAEARGNLAVLDAASGDAALAAAELAVVIRDNPNLESAYANLATAYLDLDRAEDAVRVCRAGLRRAGASAQLCHALGAAYHAQKRYGPAIRQYRAALEFDPEYTLAHRNIARAYAAVGREQLARDHLKRAAGTH